MSTPADIVRDLAALVDALAALLQTDTAREIPNIARDLGATKQLNEVVDRAKGLLDQLRDGAVPLHRMVIDADALVALLGLVPPLTEGMAGMSERIAVWVQSLALPQGDPLNIDDAAQAASVVAVPLRQVSDVLDQSVEIAEGVVALTAPEQWTGLIESLNALGQAVLELKADPSAAQAAAVTS
ncbi:hypothetical protein [Chitinolyticbacter meiyuanensis]|uniref:hypothetical protein n=1 Tax=Chitinolyticbacter meiyuanensis TaxID=682798 RepID=UPI0011E5BFBD|nr:hypothetical protein [Chitinolyticbacter meiyuanensis]